jgi:hypothetical protein
MTDVVRRYLIREFPVARISSTTRELAYVLRYEATVPFDRTLGLFERIDLLKFAHASVAADDARRIGEESRVLVHEIDHAKHAEAERLAAEAKAKAEQAGATADRGQAA